MPPGTLCASNTVTPYPRPARSRAQVRPAGPAPTTATRSAWIRGAGRISCVGPTVSATKRLSAAMATGSSTSPRVQALSQRWVQMRPQTLGNGLGSAATR
ncbi:MAG: hypothetical protein BWY94_02395 [Actinobacteria bacterium ADurb.BinA094]|nr:MAG: hypothetical protein BWY94_02395 [Actinobacteria bacterium ADurb.BinA094]